MGYRKCTFGAEESHGGHPREKHQERPGRGVRRCREGWYGWYVGLSQDGVRESQSLLVLSTDTEVPFPEMGNEWKKSVSRAYEG